MQVTSNYCLVAKDGSPEEHNDDAAAADARRGRFAISDGATESGFSRIWSRLLVEHFVRSDAAPEDWADWVPQAQQQWLDELKNVKIPWYGERQFEMGAFATFLGVVIRDQPGSVCWEASAIGDSCLFHVRNDEMLHAFPIRVACDFTNTPRLIGSRSTLEESAAPRAHKGVGELRSGDRLWLMSDAMAKWALLELEAGRAAWHELNTIFATPQRYNDFRCWVHDSRNRRALQNDDVTLMAIDFREP